MFLLRKLKSKSNKHLNINLSSYFLLKRMKRNRLYLAFVFAFLLTFVVGVYAADGEVEFSDPSTMPGNVFYGMDLFFEDMRVYFADTPEEKALLEEQFIRERIAEVNYLIVNEKYERALTAAEEVKDTIKNYDSHVAEFSEGFSSDELLFSSFEGEQVGALDKIIEYKQRMSELDRQVLAVQSELITKVDGGLIEDGTAALLVNNLREGTSQFGTSLNREQDELISKTAEASGVSEFEIEFAVEVKEGEVLGDAYREKVNQDEFVALENTMEEIKKDIEVAKAEGKDTSSAERILENAELHFFKSRDSLENEKIGEAYGQFVSAEHLVLNADRYLKEPGEISEEELNSLTNTPEEVLAEENRESRDFVDSYAEFKDNLIEKYPDKVDLIEKEYERAREIQDLGSKMEFRMKELYNTYSDLSEEDRNAKMHDFITSEYQLAYGKEYVPPGTYISFGDLGKEVEGELVGVDDGSVILRSDVEGSETEKLGVIGIGKIDVVEEINPTTGEVEKKVIGWYDGKPVQDLKAGGGFVLGYPYKDSGGFSYQYGIEGGNYYYEYTSPGGYHDKVSMPYNYDPTLTFDRGDEIHTIVYENDDGEEVKTELSATGYQIESEEGKSLVDGAYQEGKYAVAGGGEVSIDAAIGYTYESSEGKAVVWTRNPEYNNYYDSTTGMTIVPSVPSIHHENTRYVDSNKMYSYVNNGKEYNYNPSDNSWTLPNQQKIYPAMAPAPVGYEDRAKEGNNYVTPGGETWKFEEGAWKSYDSSGEVQKSYTPSPNNYYSYASGRGYVGSYGMAYEDGGSVADPSGKRWTLDSATGVWSSGVESYNPTTGAYSGGDSATGGSVAVGGGSGSGAYGSPAVSGGYGYYYDSSGNSQTYTHSGGYYTQTPSGNYNYFNPEYKVENGVASQKDMNGNTWQQDSTTGTWSCSGCSSGSTATGGQTAGNYYGGGAGYSYAAPGGGYGSSAYGSPAVSGGYDSASGTYTGGYYTGGGGYDSSGSYVGGEYGGYDSSGSYTGGTYYGSGDSYSGGSYDSSGSYSGSYSGDSGSYSGSTSTSSGSTGDSSGGSTSSGGDSGGGTTGAVISEFSNVLTGRVISDSRKYRLF